METKLIKRYPLGNPDRIWRQDNFIISTFNASAKDMRLAFTNLKEAYFNLAETGWIPKERCDEAIAIAEETGLDILIQNWNYFGGFQDSRKTEIVPEELAAYIEKTKKYRHIYGYYVWDEPFHAPDIAKAAEQTNVIEALDPSRMPFSVALPSYNLAYTYANGQYESYLENFVTTINPPVMSLDYYPFALLHPSDKEQLDNCEIYKDLFLMKKWSLKKNMPLWFYYQGTGDLESCNLSPRQITMQVNLALLYGAKGIQHYTVIGPVIDKYGEKGDYYEHIKTLNRRIAMWGRTLMALTSTGVYHSDDVLANDPSFRADFCDHFKDSAVFADTLPLRTSVGEFVDSDGNRYVILLNRDYINPSEISLKLAKTSRIYEVDEVYGRQHMVSKTVKSLKAELRPGEAKLYRIQDAKEPAYLVDYILEK